MWSSHFFFLDVFRPKITSCDGCLLLSLNPNSFWFPWDNKDRTEIMNPAGVIIDNGQITHPICVRLKILLCDFFGRWFWFSCFSSLFLSSIAAITYCAICTGNVQNNRKRHMTLKLAGLQLDASSGARWDWKATKEYLNQRGTNIRVFRVCFWAPFLPPFSLVFSPLFPLTGPCTLSHLFSPLDLPLYPPFFDSRKTPWFSLPFCFRYSWVSGTWDLANRFERRSAATQSPNPILCYSATAQLSSILTWTDHSWPRRARVNKWCALNRYSNPVALHSVALRFPGFGGVSQENRATSPDPK